MINILDFKNKVEASQKEDIEGRVRLGEQIRQLTEFNKRMSEDAIKLTNALKGESKTMGNWGELILEKILELSGLSRGTEYSVQGVFRDDEGNRLQPDVIINLPENKKLIIDSKVSLVAYEGHFNCEDHKRVDYLKEHIKSSIRHIDNLSSKRYQDIHDINTPDFVMMFIPIEPALILAFQNKKSLLGYALNKGIHLVSPSTLLFSLRTIANIWMTEKQNRNAIDIARRGGLLYDKFVGFYHELERLGKSLDKSRYIYDDSIKRLMSGKGNLAWQVEELKKMGVKSNNQLPERALE